MSQHPIYRFYFRAILTLVVLSAASALAPPVFSQQQGMDELAKNLARVLAKSHRKSVIVLDFTDLDGKRPELGVLLADQLSSALAKSNDQFQIIDRARRNEAVDLHSISAQPVEMKTFAKLIAKKTGAEAMVLGRMLPGIGNIYLDIECYQVPKGKRIARFSNPFSLPQELAPLFEKWMKTNGAIPVAGNSGYTIPQCEWCPQPVYSDKAVRAKVHGTIVLQIIVGADGKVKNVRLVSGMGYGLDEKAMETASTWRLRPALGPDGKPAAVAVIVQITFRLLI